MKAVLAVVMLALGMALGLAAGVVIRVPEAIEDPSMLLPRDSPDPCLKAVDAAEEMADVNQDYLALLRDTYLPMLERYATAGVGARAPATPGAVAPETDGTAAGAAEAPAVGEMLSANQRMTDLSERTAAAASAFSEAKVGCRSGGSQVSR